MVFDVAEIEATNRCNARCLHCPRDAMTRPLGMMSWDTFETVADKILRLRGVRVFSFSGMGEPTLNPDLPRFIAYVSNRVSTVLTTNASMLSSAMIQRWIEAGLGHVAVSFNGHDAALYRLMSGGLELERVDKRLRTLVRLAGDRLHISANVSVTIQTRPHLAKIRDYLFDLGIRDVHFSMCHNRGGYLRDRTVCDTPLPPVGEGRCDIFASTLFVAWNGRVLACCHDLEAKGEIGDLLTEGLETIVERRGRILQEGVRFPMCKHCNDMYRFARDHTPDGRPLSEWIYLLSTNDGSETDVLLEIIRRQEAHIEELRQTIAGYERGRFIRFTRWLQDVKRELMNCLPFSRG